MQAGKWSCFESSPGVRNVLIDENAWRRALSHHTSRFIIYPIEKWVICLKQLEYHFYMRKTISLISLVHSISSRRDILL